VRVEAAVDAPDHVAELVPLPLEGLDSLPASFPTLLEVALELEALATELRGLGVQLDDPALGRVPLLEELDVRRDQALLELLDLRPELGDLLC